MSFFISDAYADTGAAAAGQGSPVAPLIMMVAMFAIFYFLLIRPQRKRQLEQDSMVKALQVGDEVVFAGGLLGRITKLDDNFAVVELGDGVSIKIQRNAVLATLPKGTIKSI